MNILVIFIVICGTTTVFGAPAKNFVDNRPILDAISSQDELPIVDGDRTAILEAEGYPSQGLTLYDNSQQKYHQTFQSNAVPIVDTIQEHEKYGNDGERPFDRALVNTYESFSNFVNKLIEAPKQYARSFSRAITATLDQYGAKLVGLA